MSSFRETSLTTVTFSDKAHPEGLPLCVDDWTLAFHLGISGATLWYAVTNQRRLYKTFTVKKASGGRRTLHNPSMLMRVIGAGIRRVFLLPLVEKLGSHVTAYRKERSTLDAAKRHLADCPVCAHRDLEHTCSFDVDPLGRGVTKLNAGGCAACAPVPPHACPRKGVKVHMDLKDFFGSTRLSWVRDYFHGVGYNHEVSSLLAGLLTVPLERGVGVPQGGKASGDITNLVADKRLDQPLLAKLPAGWTYSRYADDLYFSHPDNLHRVEVERLINIVRHVVRESGYVVNHKKTRVQRQHQRQQVLGVVINERANMAKTEYRRLRAIIHHCHAHGFEAAAAKNDRPNGAALQGWLEGKFAYLQNMAGYRVAELRARLRAAQLKHPEGTELSFTFTPKKTQEAPS